MAISFVAANSWNSSSSSNSYTLERPTGVQSGDFMVAIFAVDTFSSGGARTVTPPSGWTLQTDFSTSFYLTIGIMTRTAGSSEPSTWTGSFSGASSPDRASIVCAYRGASGLGNQNDNVTGGTSSFSTGSASNPTATSWRLTAGAYSSTTTSFALESNEVIERADDNTDNLEVAFFDSNGTVSVASHSRTLSRDAVWESAGGWIGILLATAGEAVEGTMSLSLPSVPEIDIDGALSYSASVDVELPLPTMAASGIATAPEGTLAILILPTMTASAATEASGTQDVIAAPIITIATETRQFGVRVVTPESETRVVTPKLGASD